MKPRIQLAVLAMAALSAAIPVTAAAQEARPLVGVGIAIFPLSTGYAGAPTVEVYLPLQIAPTFRLEPSLGIRTSNGPSGGNDTRDLTLGIGGFYIKRLSAHVDACLGGRLKLNFARFSTPGVSDSGTDVVVAGAVGGEYYFVPHFSLGLEANLGYYQNSNVSGDDSGLFTSGLAFLRLYF
jgi:hypothetical protein